MNDESTPYTRRQQRLARDQDQARRRAKARKHAGGRPKKRSTRIITPQERAALSAGDDHTRPSRGRALTTTQKRTIERIVYWAFHLAQAEADYWDLENEGFEDDAPTPRPAAPAQDKWGVAFTDQSLATAFGVSRSLMEKVRGPKPSADDLAWWWDEGYNVRPNGHWKTRYPPDGKTMSVCPPTMIYWVLDDDWRDEMFNEDEWARGGTDVFETKPEQAARLVRRDAGDAREAEAQDEADAREARRQRILDAIK